MYYSCHHPFKNKQNQHLSTVLKSLIGGGVYRPLNQNPNLVGKDVPQSLVMWFFFSWKKYECITIYKSKAWTMKWDWIGKKKQSSWVGFELWSDAKIFVIVCKGCWDVCVACLVGLFFDNL